VTRNPKYDWTAIEREYIFDAGSPPVSYDDLVAKYGMARSGLSEIARKGRWYERREEFRQQLGVKAVERLGEEWVRFETATREKMMTVGIAYLDKYQKALEAGEIKVSTRDMVQIAAMLRTLTQDATAARTNGEEVDLIDPETHPIDELTARRILAAVELDHARRLNPGPDDPEGAEAFGAASAGAD
jgi:hypothetical protein